MFRTFFLLSVLVLFMGAACERPVELDLDLPKPKLVVVSNFTNDQVLQVRVSQSKSVLDPEPTTFVSNANVELFQGETFLEKLVLMQLPGQTPYYTTIDFQLEVDVLYTIKVEAPGLDPITATSKIPPEIKILSFGISDLELVPISGKSEIDYAFNVSLTFEDPAAEKNYYQLNFYQRILEYELHLGDTSIINSYLRQVEFSPSNDNNYFIAYFTGGVLFEDQPFNGEIISYNFPFKLRLDPSRYLLDNFFVELKTLSKEYYDYHYSLSRQQDASEGGFDEPVLIHNNIKNGFGIFGGYNNAVDSTSVIF